MVDVLRRRLRAQRLIGPRFGSAAEAVSWFGAMQAQDYRGALWGIGQRVGATREATEAALEAEIASRALIRTWPMRGTLHFVAADDARWMTRLLAPRVIRRAASRYRELGLDGRTIERSRVCLEAALAGGRSLTRPEAYAALERARISPAGQRGIHILGLLSMEGLLCMGALRGKQPTFVLLDEWIPRSRELEGDAALAELARRYVRSHGPAGAPDFAWWAGLTLGEARRGLELARPAIDGARGGWESSRLDAPSRARLGVHLLPPYDEYAVAYRDRSAFLDPDDLARAKHGIFAPIVLIEGRIGGTWGRDAQKSRVAIHAALWGKPAKAALGALAAAVARYGAFVGRPVTWRADGARLIASG